MRQTLISSQKGTRIKIQGLHTGLKYRNPTSEDNKWGFNFMHTSGFKADNGALNLDIFQDAFGL
jgi:hypothetical protein